MPSPRTATTSKSPTTRSRVSNGRALVAGADGRSATSRRYRDLMAEMANDMGGPDLLSEAQRQLIRRAAGLAVQAEAEEAKIIAGKPVDLDSYVKAVNAINRVLNSLGLKRVARDATLDLKDYLSTRHPAHEAAE